MEWTKGPEIGRGATAAVHLAADSRSGELFAVKSAELSLSAPLRNEQYFLSKLASPRIVKYLGFSLTSENNTPTYNLHIEYVPNGTLFDAVRAKGKFGEPLIKLYARQILQGLDHLHGNSVAHCDVKSRNVLIGEDGAKIADFGCAKFVGGSNSTEFSGTPAFMAPEVARGERQGFEADVWAVGCVIVEMASGHGPWPETGDSSAVSALYRIGYSGSVPEFPGSLSAEGKDFLTKCLERDWKQRWTVKELLEHPFLRDSGRDFGAETASPSSVLDKGLWDSAEVSESQRELGGFDHCSVLERIKVLSGNESFSCWDFCDDEDWLTLRDNENHEEEEEDNCFDHEEDVNVIVDGFVFGQELPLIITQASGVFSYTSFVMECNNIDLKMSTKNSCFDSIFYSISFFPLYFTNSNFASFLSHKREILFTFLLIYFKFSRNKDYYEEVRSF